MNKKFTLKISAGDQEILFTFAQLNYFTRNKIASLTTSYSQGNVLSDVGLVSFYNIKYALKEAKGLVDESGGEYKLTFVEGEDCLTDECVDELLASELDDALLYSAMSLGAKVPTEILNPVTKLPIEGVEIIASKEKGEEVKKP